MHLALFIFCFSLQTLIFILGKNTSKTTWRKTMTNSIPIPFWVSSFPQTETCCVFLVNRLLRIFRRSFKWNPKKGRTGIQKCNSAEHRHTSPDWLFLWVYSCACSNKVTLSMTWGSDNWKQVRLFSSAPFYSFKSKKLAQRRPQQEKQSTTPTQFMQS